MHFPLKFECDKRCHWSPCANHLVRDKISFVVTRAENLAQKGNQLGYTRKTYTQVRVLK